MWQANQAKQNPKLFLGAKRKMLGETSIILSKVKFHGGFGTFLQISDRVVRLKLGTSANKRSLTC